MYDDGCSPVKSSASFLTAAGIVAGSTTGSDSWSELSSIPDSICSECCAPGDLGGSDGSDSSSASCASYVDVRASTVVPLTPIGSAESLFPTGVGEMGPPGAVSRCQETF